MTNEPTKDEPKNEEKYSDYPMTAITAPHPHDVLSGRGGGTNVHLGNTVSLRMTPAFWPHLVAP
jgi:hypothetical protein